MPMKTPAGFDCAYFYGDYFRGRSVEECRLLKASAQPWAADLCGTCPVPGILRANACEHMQLRAAVSRPLQAFFRRRVQVTAVCQKSGRSVAEPHVGCGDCHPIPPIFNVKK